MAALRYCLPAVAEIPSLYFPAFFLIEFLIIIPPIIRKITGKIILGPLEVHNIEYETPFIKIRIPLITNKRPIQKLFSNLILN